MGQSENPMAASSQREGQARREREEAEKRGKRETSGEASPGTFVVEGKGTTCLVPVPALPSPQQRELALGLRDHLESNHKVAW